MKLKKEEEAHIKERPVTVKDKHGRVMEKIYPKMRSKRVPNPNRRPIKRPPLRKKMSFTDQYEFAEDFRPVERQNSLIGKATVEKMKVCGRWPIPEMLVSRPQKERFVLKIDSIM